MPAALAPARDDALHAARRTYRYLRLAIAVSLIALAVSVVDVSLRVGVLPSISSYFYTASRTVFTGVLVATALGLVSLAGWGLERMLLNIAALLAPLIVIVPTAIGPGELSFLPDPCPPGVARCVPEDYFWHIANGIGTYLTVGWLVIALTVVLRLTRQLSLAQLASAVIPAAIVLLTLLAAWFLARPFFILNGHALSTLGFFLSITCVVALNAARARRSPRPARRRYTLGYAVIAAALVSVIVAFAIVELCGLQAAGPIPPVLVCEVAALILFLLFWTLQSLEKWDSLTPLVTSTPRMRTRRH